SELRAPEHKEPAPSDPASAAKPGEAGSDGKDPLWFLKQPSAAGESNGMQAPTARTQPGEAAPAAADAVKLSRPEVLRASLPPLFGAAEERPTIFRTAPAHAPKAPDGAAPAAKMPPVTPAPSEVGKTVAGSVPTARTPEAAHARTLEQVVGELLEPVIRHWLETNLPRMVEKVVRDEVARALAAERRAPKA